MWHSRAKERTNTSEGEWTKREGRALEVRRERRRREREEKSPSVIRGAGRGEVREGGAGEGRSEKRRCLP
eukprot:scaffold3055_cov27-Tisochrysis_lutea.AAC.1